MRDNLQRYPTLSRIGLSHIYFTFPAALAAVKEEYSFGNGYIWGGEDTEIMDWPFMVSLQDRTGGHFCGGTLLDSAHVLTAGHCIDGDNP